MKVGRSVLASLQVILNFFFFYSSKKLGRSDDGKRNILWEWPNWYPSQVFQGWRYVIKLLCPGNYASSDPCSLRKFAYIASRSIRPDGRTVIQLAEHKRINYCSKYVFPKDMFNSTYLHKADIRDDTVLAMWSLNESLLSNATSKSLTESEQVKVPYPEG